MTVLPDDGVSMGAGFPDATHEQWQQLVAGVLRRSGRELSGPEAEQALSTALDDGLTVRPLYGPDTPVPDAGLPGFPPYVRGGRPVGGWGIRQWHRSPDPERGNEEVLADLECGVDSLWLSVGAGALPVAGLARALRGVRLDLAPIVLDAGAQAAAAADELLRLYDRQGVPADAARGNLGADPLGHFARTGRAVAFDDAVALARRVYARYPGVRALTVDALPYHDAGATAAQELGCSMATGVAYLRLLAGAGLDVEHACRQLEFRYAATADQFLTIAKLRAARRLWARIAQVGGAAVPVPQVQHAVTSTVMMTRRDPYVNMLRTTLAGLGAGVGGADSVTVLPFDHALGLPDAFARRIARNTSSILLAESHLGQVADPAGGSWYVERLTDELAHTAWEFFQQLEQAGGQERALRSGLVEECLAAAWQDRSRALATRREPITGVSEFPHLAEQPVERPAAPAHPGGGLPRVRRDEAYEALRSRSDAHLAATGARPAVFLAALGPESAHAARVSFASHLFQAGGVRPVQEPRTVDADSVAAAFAASGAAVACLCSTDELYEEQAEPVARALRAAGARWILLAGRPGARPDIDGHVFMGCDAVAVLTSVLDRSGVTA
ncbi:heterodimeric methylmalonyl-CoA mutase small subunit [Actinacidiphila yanglinensis]|uniref:Heterodimeric methylmalonyl-CoA mutase small subunit n=1 Tax=Actinacidiphila yanglinensis TaxID=310779 RepID=A0A1H6D883_9ACTN|nr:methylmalonyl-CoA mutase subunit beta [Actinacidiphila yanglinensis]SEG80706.1 heterodimeric methylmalonyl-CoA mutase small subunit [Actinacidiphila yanglinensis]